MINLFDIRRLFDYESIIIQVEVERARLANVNSDHDIIEEELADLR